MGSLGGACGLLFLFLVLESAVLTAVVPFSGHYYMGVLRLLGPGNLPCGTSFPFPCHLRSHTAPAYGLALFVLPCVVIWGVFVLVVLHFKRISGQVWLLIWVLCRWIRIFWYWGPHLPPSMGEQHCILWGFPRPTNQPTTLAPRGSPITTILAPAATATSSWLPLPPSLELKWPLLALPLYQPVPRPLGLLPPG